MEKERQSRIKKGLLGGVLVFLLLPMIQGALNIFELEPLKGAIAATEKPVFTKYGWKTGEFQQQYETYLNNTFGFRSLLIRLNNQQAYSFYNEARANGVIIGKDNYLYEENYIRAWQGTDFSGEAAIREQVYKLKQIQDTLKKLHKDLLVVFAPGKASFFPEFLPDTCKQRKDGRTNYKSYVSEMKGQGINYLDFNRWFRKMKPVSKYPLYGKCGIHWSKYGEFLAADSLINTIGKMRNTAMSRWVQDRIEVRKENSPEDNDIGEGMNLLFKIGTYPMAYPVYHLEKTRAKQPKVLVVADSYYWGMFNAGLSRDIFDNGQFWYYNENIYPDSFEKVKTVAGIRINEGIEAHDMVVIICTDANLYKFAFGFIDQAYNAYFPAK